MPIPPSTCYKSTYLSEGIVPRSTTPSGVPPECIHGVDWIGIDPRAVTSSVGALTLRSLSIPERPPVLSALNPDASPVPAPDFDLIVGGEGFTENSVIVWNEGDEPTTFIDSNSLKTVVKPSTVGAPLPFTLPVYVREGELKSNVLEFTFAEGESARRSHSKTEEAREEKEAPKLSHHKKHE